MLFIKTFSYFHFLTLEKGRTVNLVKLDTNHILFLNLLVYPIFYQFCKLNKKIKENTLQNTSIICLSEMLVDFEGK